MIRIDTLFQITLDGEDGAERGFVITEGQARELHAALGGKFVTSGNMFGGFDHGSPEGDRSVTIQIPILEDWVRPDGVPTPTACGRGPLRPWEQKAIERWHYVRANKPGYTDSHVLADVRAGFKRSPHPELRGINSDTIRRELRRLGVDVKGPVPLSERTGFLVAQPSKPEPEVETVAATPEPELGTPSKGRLKPWNMPINVGNAIQAVGWFRKGESIAKVAMRYGITLEQAHRLKVYSSGTPAEMEEMFAEWREREAIS